MKKFIRTLMLAASIGLCAAFALPALAAAEKAAPHRVVVHVNYNDPTRWSQMLNNVRNLQGAFGKNNVQIEVVAHGPGIAMYKLDSPVSSQLQEIADTGVAFAVCGNTLRAQHLTIDDMHPAAREVPSGVA